MFEYKTFETIAGWAVSRWDRDPILPPSARLAGALGLALWVGVVVSGRLIAYNWFQ